jgi:DNA-binding NarL/FixJ family response regulator
VHSPGLRQVAREDHGSIVRLLADRPDELTVERQRVVKQIGARLFISEHTVDSHVRSILNKLGFGSRAQIAAWIASSNQ